MNKIYYFFDREVEKCHFFNDEECASFYKDLIGEYNSIETLKVKSDDFEGTDVFTISSFKKQLLKELEWGLDEDEEVHIKQFINKLDSKIREIKINTILN